VEMQMNRILRLTSVAVIACALSATAVAGGPLGIDHRLTLDEKGIWARRNQLAAQDLSEACDTQGETQPGKRPERLVGTDFTSQFPER
jgi:hypothetical protein